MNKIEIFYPLVQTENENDFDHLFLNYHNNIILEDDYLSGIYLQIERNLKRMTVENQFLFKQDKKVIEEEILIKDRLGQVMPSKIIKKMSSVNHVYEIRINESFVKHRILFFTCELSFDRLVTPSLIFSYGFGKEELKEDVLTQSLTECTQNIRNNLYSSNIDANIIGEEF